MGEKSLHAVGRSIFQMEQATMMRPDDGNKSQPSLPVCVGYEKRVDCKKKTSSNSSIDVFWDPSRKALVKRS